MDEKFNIKDVESVFPEAVVEKSGKKEIDYEKLCLILAEEVSDLKDQLNEKDYQITNIYKRLEKFYL